MNAAESKTRHMPPFRLHRAGRSSHANAAHAHAPCNLFHDVFADALGHFFVVLFIVQTLHLHGDALNVHHLLLPLRHVGLYRRDRSLIGTDGMQGFQKILKQLRLVGRQDAFRTRLCTVQPCRTGV